MTILFWGTGSYAFNWVKNNNAILKNFEYIKFISRDPTEKTFLDKEVIAPNEIMYTNYDKFCILSSFEENIRLEVVELYQVSVEKIITIQELEEDIINIAPLQKRFGKKTLIQHLLQDDLEMLSLVRNYYDYKYIKEKYQSYVNKYQYNDTQESENRKIIWMCWFQGYKNAPKIVQACINSVKKNMPNYKIILITEENISEFATFPKYILDNYRKGNISKTHFSDLLRLELLIQYGGIWIDATVLFTSSIPLSIQNSSLFLFKFNKEEDIEPRRISSWFIVAKARNKILILTQKLLYQYWKENNKLFNYYLFHYFFRISTEFFLDEWNSSIHITSNNNLMEKELFLNFKKEKYEKIKKISFCQKLSYKLKIPENIHGTFYEAVLKEYL